MSSVSAKFKNDHHIQARREAEFREQQLSNSIRGERNMHLKATWEAKSDKAIVNRMVKSRIEDLKKRKASNLMQRRARLAELLAIEDR
eukprot:CAMPEP_0170480166 /NCGR_PEP_ID=MMETSP0208-20121228/1114_1 /TAXON_ID=197538 /ORGANISM="Strombidium inclinatum, Strain S3" /LENGTH=87 /DNA_ID=CAMNT_0010752669 /DNA_START=9 /DNA_END=272 /DNA_ORIENTATION=+